MLRFDLFENALVIHGLVHNSCFFWDNFLIGACLSAIDLIRSIILVVVSSRSLLLDSIPVDCIDIP